MPTNKSHPTNQQYTKQNKLKSMLFKSLFSIDFKVLKTYLRIFLFCDNDYQHANAHGVLVPIVVHEIYIINSEYDKISMMDIKK